jgi:hypothetical protein
VKRQSRKVRKRHEPSGASVQKSILGLLSEAAEAVGRDYKDKYRDRELRILVAVYLQRAADIASDPKHAFTVKDGVFICTNPPELLPDDC